MTDLTALATQAYAAMVAPPPFVTLATSLVATDTTRTERAALLDNADAPMREAALRYIAEPELTRER
jgi:hypothetical protein